MRFATLALTLALSVPLPAAGMAAEKDFFVGLDISGGLAFGSSSTTDGGGVLPYFNGDGVVGNVRFGETIGIGGHAGYRFNPSWSVIISYQHVSGSIGWDATFPTYGGASGFDGNATSDVFVGHLAYQHPLTKATTLTLKAGLGVGFNRLSGIVETDKATGYFVSDVGGKTRVSPVAQLGAGLQHKLSPNMTIGLDALLAYAGGFETANTRSGNLGVTNINPYKIDNVWRTNLGASFRLAF
ncbi:MAG TPA: outer membrane beta-barrel protein [Rhizobiaceae bacterium]|nr:outer membrane beta-barrel protein [Rhizobiaceae bacterium]